MKLELTRGMFAQVDPEDFAYLSQWSWAFNGHYAFRTARIEGKKRTVYMHRVIMNTPEDLDTDHLNRDRLDNRKANLRVCTRSENLQNRASWKWSKA